MKKFTISLPPKEKRVNFGKSRAETMKSRNTRRNRTRSQQNSRAIKEFS